MSVPSPRTIFSRLLRWVCSVKAEIYPEENLAKPAIVFAPHFDDETLGCGGTIIRKRAAGADVSIVFMTDGSRSHKQINAQELGRMRAHEAMAAGAALAVPPENIYMLDYQDRNLSQHAEEAAERVAAILSELQPEELFIPYHAECHVDHAATNAIVRQALKRGGCRPELYEYPVWLWHHWPWIPMPMRLQRQSWKLARASLVQKLGYALVRDFNCRTAVKEVLPRKRMALEQYKSQMFRLNSDADWWTLPEIAGGEFLKSFFNRYELFRHVSNKGKA